MVRPALVETTPIGGVLVFERTPSEDDRGSLDRLFDRELAERYSPGFSASQVNHTVTKRRGTVRGMHFQMPPDADTKIVTCLRGRVFDVVVDVRQGSPTLLHWHGEILTPEDNRSLLLPPGIAHGYQALADDSELLYIHGASYQPEAEAGLRPDDPAIGIDWPEPRTLISMRDKAHPLLAADWSGVCG